MVSSSVGSSFIRTIFGSKVLHITCIAILALSMVGPVAALDKHIFVVRDYSNPITLDEITNWRNQIIESLNAGPDAQICWGEPGPHHSLGPVNATDEGKIIAYGFAVTGENDKFVTATFVGKVGVLRELEKTWSTRDDHQFADAVARIYKQASEWFTTHALENQHLVRDTSDWPVVGHNEHTEHIYGVGDITNNWVLHRLNDDKRYDKNYDNFIIESKLIQMTPDYFSSVRNIRLYGNHIWSTENYPEIVTYFPLNSITGTTSMGITLGTGGASFSTTYTQGDASEVVWALMPQKLVAWTVTPNSDAAKSTSLAFTPSSEYMYQKADHPTYRQLAQVYMGGDFQTMNFGQKTMVQSWYINGNY